MKMDATRLRVVSEDEGGRIIHDAVSQKELDRVYDTFNKGIDGLQHSIQLLNTIIRESNESMNARYSELSERIKELEQDRDARTVRKNLLFSAIKMFPKTFGAVVFLLCAGLVHISQLITDDQRVEVRSAIRTIEKPTP